MRNKTKLTKGAGSLAAHSLPDKAQQAREAELVRLARQGDADAWAQLYTAHVGRLHGYFRYRESSEADALTSEVFMRAVEALKRGSYEWRGKPFGAWLFSIARKVL